MNLEPKYPASRQRRTTSRPTRRADAYMNRQYLDPVFLGRYPEELRRDLRRGVARVAGGRTSTLIRAADRLPRHQLLHAQRRAPRPRRRGRCSAARGAADAGAPTPRPAGRSSRKALTDTLLVGEASATATSRSTSPRTAPPSTIRRRPSGGRVDDPLRVDYYASTCARCHAAIAAGRRRARLLRLVAARQPRVVARLLEALRPRARRLRDASSARRRTARASTPT